MILGENNNPEKLIYGFTGKDFQKILCQAKEKVYVKGPNIDSYIDHIMKTIAEVLEDMTD